MFYIELSEYDCLETEKQVQENSSLVANQGKQNIYEHHSSKLADCFQESPRCLMLKEAVSGRGSWEPSQISEPPPLIVCCHPEPEPEG